MNPYEEAMNALATAFNVEAQKLDQNAGDQTMHAATYANQGDVQRARECLDLATAYGHRAFAWSLAARRIEEALDRLHNEAIRAEGDAAVERYGAERSAAVCQCERFTLDNDNRCVNCGRLHA